MSESRYPIDPEIGAAIVTWLGWALIAMGLLKILFYLIGEIRPNVWAGIKSPSLRKLVTGTGNRLLFGLGGLLTVILGFGAIGIAKLILRLDTFFG